MRRIGPPRIRRIPHGFEGLVAAIVSQQLSNRAAATIHLRLGGLFPGGRPEPARLLALPADRIRGAGLSWAKVASLQDLARRVVEGSLDLGGLRALPDEEVVDRLVQVRGIGRWSAQMHLIFALGRLDVWPCGDLGVRQGLARFAGVPPEPRALEAAGEPYRPWRTLAAWYLWRAADGA